MVGEPLLVILPSRSMPAYASEAHLFGNLLNDLLQDELWIATDKACCLELHASGQESGNVSIALL